MSGLDFVAVLGIAASAIEVVKACSKIVGRIRKCGHSAAFEDLKIQLQLFSMEVDHLSNPVNHLDLDPATEAILGEVLNGCRHQLEKLDTALQSIVLDTKSSKLRRAIYGIRTGAREKEVREILSILSAYQASILVHLSRRNLQNTAQIPRVISLLEEKIISQGSSDSQDSIDQIDDISSSEAAIVALPQPSRLCNTQRLRRASKCARGICECQCHLSLTKTPWSSVAVSLAQGIICSCDSREYSVAMQLFHKFCMLKFSMSWYGGVSINFSLQYYGVVQATSPGFMVLYKCQWGSMSLSQACNELRTLRMKGEINFKELDPYGRGWIEKVLNRPWESHRRNIQFGLLEEIFSESTIIPTDKILLSCMKWMGYGPHLHLLERLLVLGLDPSEAGIELFPKWPTPQTLLLRRDDPFYIKVMAKVIHYDFEFGFTSRLQRAALMDDFSEVKSLLDHRDTSLFPETNFRGQTALHLTILNPRMLLHLIDNGFSKFIDYEDLYGATPLMYAVAYDQSESADILLNCGADANLIGLSDGWGFFSHLIFHGNFSLLQKLINHYRKTKGEIWAQQMLDNYLWDCMAQDTLQWMVFKPEGLQYLLQATGNYGMTSREGNTLLHLARNSEQANILLSRPELPINHPNFRGHTPLMLFSRLHDPLLVRRIISAGAVVNAVDRKSSNALHHVIRNRRERSWLDDKLHIWNRALNTIAILLAAGANEVNCDSCTCFCSVAGCTPTSLFFHLRSQFDRCGVLLSVVPWQLEWYLLLKHLRGPGTIHQILQALFRYQRFEELGMTHTCCFSRLRYSFSIEDEYTLWKDEEKCAEDELVAIEIAEDAREINEEQKELVKILEQACTEFRTQSRSSDEELWISLIARRAVFIEEANMKLVKRASCRIPDKVSAEKSEAKTKKEIEVLSEEPFCYADYVSDNLYMADRHVMPTVSNSDCVLEVQLQEFLTAIEMHPFYDNILPIAYNRSSWDTERKELAQLLLEEAQRVRQSPLESRNWDFDSLGPAFP